MQVKESEKEKGKEKKEKRGKKWRENVRVFSGIELADPTSLSTRWCGGVRVSGHMRVANVMRVYSRHNFSHVD